MWLFTVLALLVSPAFSADFAFQMGFSEIISTERTCDYLSFDPSLDTGVDCPEPWEWWCDLLDTNNYTYYVTESWAYPCQHAIDIDDHSFTNAFIYWKSKVGSFWNYFEFDAITGEPLGDIPIYLDIGAQLGDTEVTIGKAISLMENAGFAVDHHNSPRSKRFIDHNLHLGTTDIVVTSPFANFDGVIFSVLFGISCSPAVAVVLSISSTGSVIEGHTESIYCTSQGVQVDLKTRALKYDETEVTFCIATSKDQRCLVREISTSQPCRLGPGVPCESMFCYIGAASYSCLTLTYKIVVAILVMISFLIFWKFLLRPMLRILWFVVSTFYGTAYFLWIRASPLGEFFMLQRARTTVVQLSMDAKDLKKVLVPPPKAVQTSWNPSVWVGVVKGVVVYYLVSGNTADAVLAGTPPFPMTEYVTPGTSSVGFPVSVINSLSSVTHVIGETEYTRNVMTVSFEMPDLPGTCILFSSYNQSLPDVQSVEGRVCLVDVGYTVNYDLEYVAWSYEWLSAGLAARCASINPPPVCPEGYVDNFISGFNLLDCINYCQHTSGAGTGCWAFNTASSGIDVASAQVMRPLQVYSITTETPWLLFQVDFNYTDSEGSVRTSQLFSGVSNLRFRNGTEDQGHVSSFRATATQTVLLKDVIGSRRMYIPFDAPDFVGFAPFPSASTPPAHGFGAVRSEKKTNSCSDISYAHDIVLADGTHGGRAGAWTSEASYRTSPISAKHLSDPAKALFYSPESPVRVHEGKVSSGNYVGTIHYKGSGLNTLQVTFDTKPFEVGIVRHSPVVEVTGITQVTKTIGADLFSTFFVATTKPTISGNVDVSCTGSGIVQTSGWDCRLSAAKTGNCTVGAEVSSTEVRVTCCVGKSCKSSTFKYTTDTVFKVDDNEGTTVPPVINPDDLVYNYTGLEWWVWLIIAIVAVVMCLGIWKVLKMNKEKAKSA